MLSLGKAEGAGPLKREGLLSATAALARQGSKILIVERINLPLI
jgi:hypothetical protein